MPTKAKKHVEAKRQSVHVPASKLTIDDGGSYAIDHQEYLDSQITPDTSVEPAEDIIARDQSDLSFWGNSWCWAKSQNSYGDKPEDSWFINPTAKLIGEVMHSVPLVHSACEVALLKEHKEELDRERERHLDFLRTADSAEIISESLDMLTSYQSRFFEAVQRYLGRQASYDNQVNNERAEEDQIEAARLAKVEAGAQCRGWVAKLIALVEAYHAVMSDDRAYNLTYNFSPKPDTAKFGLYKWSVTSALGRVGRRLARSIKTGSLDAERYRIPRPWLNQQQALTARKADEMIGDFS